MNRRWYRQWERTRSKGKFRFILIYTLFFIVSSICYSMINYIFGDYDNFQDFIFGMLTYIVIFFVVGLLLSLLCRVYSEKKYKKQLK